MTFVATPPVERFWADVRKTDTCWLWMGGRIQDGYGRFWDGRRRVPAHRWAYEFLVGPIPKGLQLDHLCRVRHCVNPDHLEPVTNRENILRGVGPSAQHARKTHCDRGHEFTPENTRITTDGGRRCRACKREQEGRPPYPDGLTPKQRAVLAVLADAAGQLKAWEVAERAGLTEASAHALLRRLEDAEFVECEIPDPFHPRKGPFLWSL